MREVSVTVTVGIGSEKHNHDLEYRETLEHVHDRPNGVIEVIPYRDYQEQINELVRPYIEAYNAKVDKRYQEAWNRYNRGEIKTKPRKRDYKHVGYDYYTDHLHDTYYDRKTGKQEELPMFRSLIIGIGDRADRQNGIITEEEAIDVLTKTVEQFRKDFPYFHLLGASLHLDEEGFYHAHLDYKPFYEQDIGQGLGFGIGQERALELMKLEPEQSIVNGRDKAPIRFNAFRNMVYTTVEEMLALYNIRLQYGISAVKEPNKDSSRNQRLENWQATQDASRSIQHQKNVALDILSKDNLTPEEIQKAIEAANNIDHSLAEIERQPRSRWKKDNVVVHFTLFDQLRGFVTDIVETMAVLMRQIEELVGRVKKQEAEIDKLAEENKRLQKYKSIDGRIGEIERRKDLARDNKDERY